MGDTKKIAVIVRDRQGEALRVSGGLTLADDIVEVFVLDGQARQERSGRRAAAGAGRRTWTSRSMHTNPENGFPMITVEEMAKKLLEYDIVVPY